MRSFSTHLKGIQGETEEDGGGNCGEQLSNIKKWCESLERRYTQSLAGQVKEIYTQTICDKIADIMDIEKTLKATKKKNADYL